MELLNDVYQETNEMLTALYLRSHSSRDDTTNLRNLESELSAAIVQSEELMLQHKGEREITSAYRRRRARLKRIADGLAWRALRFDEIRLLTYGGEPNPGYMARKSGYDAERYIVQVCYEIPQVTFAIQNDTTNILRVGDITALFADGSVQVIEAKSSSHAAGSLRAARQQQRAQLLHNYLRQGFSIEVLRKHDLALQHISASFTPTYYWKRLERICFAALERGIMWKRLDARVLVICYRIDRMPDVERLMPLALSQTGWVNPHIRLGVLSRHFEEQEKHNAVVRYIMPITAFDVDPAVVVKIMIGELDVLVLVNTSAVLQAIVAAGLSAGYKGDRLVVDHDGVTLEVSERAWSWVTYGLRTIPTLVKSIESTLASIASNSGLNEEPSI